MKTYWDLDEAVRAKLTREEVSTYVDAELMVKGVLRVTEPEIVEVPSTQDVVRLTCFAVKGSSWYSDTRIGWATREAAEQALSGAVAFHHQHGVDGFVEVGEKEIEEVQVISAKSIARHKALLQQASETKAANQKAREAYLDAQRKQDDALKGLWADWHECRDKDHQMAKVVATFDSYTKTALGDAPIAMSFLRKVFTLDEIEKAADWCKNAPMRRAYEELDAPRFEETVHSSAEPAQF